MATVPDKDRENDDLRRRLEQAAEQALELRKTVMGLPDPHLRVFVDAVLIELGRHLGRSIGHPPAPGPRPVV
ncbi:hypothetical protein MKK75_29810 [Methylobacterium sp. J-030]|uniref:hypothetical protein n=1 Tax=Methylobacterium sp. J-030 TaxID=2836627 RepID=UPI001FBA042C|nr:hypothetical protein [Methylobacterium sp. J-030]MCJ2072941.1 hypothetical protein [Methylobacterium sp. J-030]